MATMKLAVWIKATTADPNRNTLTIDMGINEEKWNSKTKDQKDKIVGKRLASLLRYEVRGSSFNKN